MAKPTSRKRTKNFIGSRLIDIAIRIALGLFFAFSAGIYGRNAWVALHLVDMSHLNAASLSEGLSVFTSGLYTLMIACLYVLRLRPVNKFAGFFPSLAAVLGGFLMFGLVWFKPRTDLPLSAQVIASLLVLTGNLLAAFILTHLGRSFSILPEGRKLVMTGPYKIIRHPLYVAEAIATLGTMIIFLSTGAVVLVVTQTLLQLVRIHYEERVLTKTFPEYKDYARLTARLIPKIY